MKRFLACAAAFIGLVKVSGAATAQPAASLPVFFMENRGQADPQVKFMVKRQDFSAYFLEQEILLSWGSKQVPLRLVGAQKPSSVEGMEELSGKANFLTGTKQDQWVTDIPMNGAVLYRQVWPGIDMVYGGTERRLKSEFRVAPNADCAKIRWTYGASFHVSVESDGSLLVEGEGVRLSEDAPVLYQIKDGQKQSVAGEFQVFGNSTVGFRIGSYDHTLPLVVDPVINFSSFLGGSSQDQGTSVALDPYGNAIVAGWTTSNNFAPTGPSKMKPFSGSVDAFVAKFKDKGDQIVYCTYLGGTGDDRALGIAVDSSSNAYLTGYTTSSNFPVTTGALQTRLMGGRDAFVVKLNSAGNALLYSTYLGGTGNDSGNAIAVDSAGKAYVTGDTLSTNFPVSSPYQSTLRGAQDAFLAVLTATANGFTYSTYLGGMSDEHATAIAVNSTGNAFITGSTFSPDFPVLNAFQPITGGNQDAFVTEFNSAGRTLVFSSYLGGTGGTPGLLEEGAGIVLDSAGRITVAGTTSSVNFPVTAAALQKTFLGGNTDGFITQLDSTGKTILSSTYVGGSSVDRVTGVTADPLGYLYLVGYTASQDFSNIRSVQRTNRGQYNGFLAKFHPGLTSLIYSTYLGGTGSDAITGVAADRFGNALLVGYTSSSDFPVAGVLGAAQKYKYGTSTAFLTKIVTGWTIVVGATYQGVSYFTSDWGHNGGSNGTASWLDSVFGAANDVPIMGDWSGTGTSKMGVFRNGVWMLDYNGNGVWDGTSGGDRQFTYGQAGDIPVVGDWDGTGTLKAGYVRQGVWHLDKSGLIRGTATGKPEQVFSLGNATDAPIVGDWSGNGVTKVGVYRGGVFYLDYDGDFALTSADRNYVYGNNTDKPVVADWDGSGIDKPGVFRSGTWYLSFDQSFTQGNGYSLMDVSIGFGLGYGTPLIAK